MTGRAAAARSFDYTAAHLGPGEWHAVLRRFDDATIEQTWPYAAARVAPGRFEHFVARTDSEPVAAAQVVIARLPFSRIGVGFVKFGPVWRTGDAANGPANLANALAALREEYARRRGLSLRIMPAARQQDAGVVTDALSLAGYGREAIATPERYLVDVRMPADEIRSALKARWRSHLKKSQSNGLEARTLAREDAVSGFLALYEGMTGRKRFRDRSSIAHLRDYSRALPQALSPLWVMCYEGGQLVAGAVVSHIGDTAQYLFGATSRRGLELRAGYFVQWHVIQLLQARGCVWYDLGGDCGDAGLRQFKSGLVGRSGVMCDLPGNFDADGCAASRLASALAFRARDWRAALGALAARQSQ